MLEGGGGGGGFDSIVDPPGRAEGEGKRGGGGFSGRRGDRRSSRGPGGEGGGGAVSHVHNRKHDIIWPREAAALIKKTYTLHF